MEASQTASGQTQTQNRKSRLPSKRTLYLLILGFFLLAYTAFVWYLERIDPGVFKVSFPINDPLDLLVQFLDIFLRLLRHYVPVLLGWMLAYEIALNFGECSPQTSQSVMIGVNGAIVGVVRCLCLHQNIDLFYKRDSV